MLINPVVNMNFSGIFKKHSTKYGQNQRLAQKDWVKYVSSLKYDKNKLMPDDHKGFMMYYAPKELQIYSIKSKYWTEIPSDNKMHYPFKIHVFADKEKDFQALLQVVGKFCIDNDIHFKTLSDNFSVDMLNEDKLQKGKVITIYPRSATHFEKIAKNLSYIIKNNKLQTKKSSISGDNKLGRTGRLFYRYELNSKRFLNVQVDNETYHKNYEDNRGSNCYLPSDMSVDEDPWRKFK